ncbi:glycine cleavage system protein GcvH [archaeon]|nr:glycine cleavage system protein GcvH [archaeon]
MSSEYHVPEDLRYTRTHEWVRIEASGLITVGITDYAQKQLHDIVAVELPSVGTAVERGAVVATLESVKATADVYAPVSGIVEEVNSELDMSPERINEDPYGSGWLFKLRPKDPSEVSSLLDATSYRKLLESES